VRDVAAPIALAALLAVLRVEGRPFHLAVRALARHWAGPRWLSGLRAGHRPGTRWTPPALLMLPDGSEGRWRVFAYTGPGAVMIGGGCQIHERHRLTRALAPGRARVLVREAGGVAAGEGRRVVALGARARLRTARQRRRARPGSRGGRRSGADAREPGR